MYYEKAKEKYALLKKSVGKRDIIILGIESSCDETSIAVLKNGNEILSNVISSQIDIHSRFGGVVPEVASRNHLMAIDSVLDEALLIAGITLSDIDCIGVTYGAGLVGALLVGVSYAKSLAYALNIPLIGVNHIYGHISANYIADKELKPPFISLVVSGGHTALLKVDKTKKTLIGTTHDDAIGEAYDKVAKVLGLGYPGGPIVDKLAKNGNNNIVFVKKPKSKNNFDFSYSGLKTSVINYLHTLKQAGKEPVIEDVCASFQHEAILEVVEKTILAAKKYKLKTIVLAGGVAANSHLRQELLQKGQENDFKIVIPPMSLCTDNAAMIAAEAYESLKQGIMLKNLDLNAEPNINLKFSK